MGAVPGGLCRVAAGKVGAETATEHIEDVAENIAESAEVATAGCAEIIFKPIFPVGIVGSFFCFVGKHFVGEVHLFKFRFRLFVAGMQIRVVLLGFFTICFFYF